MCQSKATLPKSIYVGIQKCFVIIGKKLLFILVEKKGRKYRAVVFSKWAKI